MSPSADDASDAVDEAWLLQQVMAGNEAAFALLYAQWRAQVYGLAYRILADVREAEDAVQEGFLHLWRKACTYNAERSSPFSWAYFIFRSKAIDRLRARERQDRGLELAAVELEAAADFVESPAEAQVREETHAVVHAALSTIAMEQREAIEMAFFAGLTHGEIAVRLGVPLGTAKARVRRGLARLSELLARARKP